MSKTGTAVGQSSTPRTASYGAALALIGCVVPVPLVVTIITAAIYITSLPAALKSLLSSWLPLSWVAIFAGLGITLALWLIIALFFKGFTSLESANPLSGSHLKNHFNALDAGFSALTEADDDGDPIPPGRLFSYNIAHRQMERYLESIKDALRHKDARWIAGTGYLHAWNLVHRAEEAMIALEPREEVIREAIYDEMSIIGSHIDTTGSLLNKLRLAVGNLSSSATQYLNDTGDHNSQKENAGSENQRSTILDETPQVTVKKLGSPTLPGVSGIEDESSLINNRTPFKELTDSSASTLSEKAIATTQDPSDAPTSEGMGEMAKDGTRSATARKIVVQEVEARNALRDVRRTINEYRDHLWEGLVNSRNLLVGTAMFTGILTYVLLCFAIIAGASPVSITAAIAYYLVGSLVGLFNRLYSESNADSAADDFNLTLARIVVTPVLSGLAAIGGVLLITLLSLTLLKTPTTPNSPPVSLGDGFNLTTNTLGIIIAAVFGLTPNLFINTLQKQAQDFTNQLQNTSPSSQTNTESQSTSNKTP